MGEITPFEAAARRVASGADHAEEARALVGQMTLDERLGCLDGDLPFWPGIVDMTAGGYLTHAWPAAHVERLGIPGIDFSDGPRGAVIGRNTAFPVSMARGASFDPELEERIGAAIGAELRARGATYTGAVCINLLRHPAWGRAQETYGEDPHQVGELGVAFTTGLQRHVMACMKHFACNSMENARFSVDVTCDDRALHEVYLPHFKRVADAGVASVMSAYNSLNGEWCGQNRDLLIGVLRDEWGWDGYVTSDFIFGLRDASESVRNGLAIEMPFRQQRALHLPDALADGSLDERDVDARVVETVATLLRFASVFDSSPDRSVLVCDEHRALAREAAVSSIVCLNNEGPLLPVEASSLRRVAVLGRLARVPNLGDAGSSNVVPPESITPLAGLRAALPEVEVVHDDADASIAEGADLTVVVVGYTKADEGEYLDQSATGALGSLFPPSDHPEMGFASEEAAAEGIGQLVSGATQAALDDDGHVSTGFQDPGGDRASLRLRAEDVELIRAAAAVSDQVVVCVMSGSTVVVPWLDEVPVTLMVWYPGMEGGHAIADVLLGNAEPGGRLPFAVPRDEADLVHFDRDATTETYGLLHGQWKLDADGVEAHLPFGWGLGYTTWSLDSATSVSNESTGDAGSAGTPCLGTVEVAVTNAGEQPGSTVVLVYGSVPGSAHERPPRRLVGFAKVAAGAGESVTVPVVWRRELLDVRVAGRWVREDHPVRLEVGFDAASLPISLDVTD
jgi:beta-glucosidase